MVFVFFSRHQVKKPGFCWDDVGLSRACHVGEAEFGAPQEAFDYTSRVENTKKTTARAMKIHQGKTKLI